LAGLSAKKPAQYRKFITVKTPFLFLSLLALSSLTTRAETILFQDSFGESLPHTKESRGKLNFDTERRQVGPLAPVDYTHNGEGWQAQTQFNAAEGVICRLFPRKSWLVAHPEWELDAGDGSYEVVFAFSLPDETSRNLGQDQAPPAPVAETILLIGQEAPDGAGELLLDKGFGVIHRTDPEQNSQLWVHGQVVEEFEPGPEDEGPHTIKIRWKQEGGMVKDIEAELDGQILKDAGGFSPGAPKVQFGGRGRLSTDYEASSLNAVHILQLTYAKK
jgi:hypothetical protein